VVALAGGTGSAKLLRGLKYILKQFVVIANIGDNFWMYGLYICPDIDIAMYTLAGIEGRKRGWGIEGDTFEVLEDLRRLGAEGWFKLGDRDLATHLLRTQLLLGGKRLTEITASLSKNLEVKQTILPPSDEHIETRIQTNEGEMHLQEFWVKRRARPKILGVRYVGAESAKATPEVRDAVQKADRILLCPGNPVTSLLPIISIGGMRNLLEKSSARKIALSPMIGGGAFSGPAPLFMKALGYEPNSLGVAKLYSGIVDEILIDVADRGMASSVERAGLICTLSETTMRSTRDERRLAKQLIRA